MVLQRHFLPVGLLLVLVLSLASTEPLDIEEYCTKVIGEYTIFDDEDVVLEMTDLSENNGGTYNCTFLPVADSRDGLSPQLVVEFLSFTASDYVDDSCTHGAIQIFNSDNNRVLNPYCLTHVPHKRYYLGPSGKVNVYNENYTKGDKMNFQLLITPVVIKARKLDNCPNGFFDCDDDYHECVDVALKCNGHPNCYTGRDEQDCSDRSSWSLDVGSGFIGAGIITVIVIILVTARACRRKFCSKLPNEKEPLLDKDKKDNEETIPKET